MKNCPTVLVLIVLIAVFGCASDKKKNDLDVTLRFYERSIKWGSYRDAQSLSDTPVAQERLDQYKDIKVISYEVLRQEVTGDFDQLSQVVEIKFYHQDQGTIKTVRDKQVWTFDDDRDVWVLQTGLPDFISAAR